MKEEVMRCKSRLKSECIFIEHDLRWEDKKSQEKIARWMKKEKGKGKHCKIGYGRVDIGKRWRHEIGGD